MQQYPDAAAPSRTGVIIHLGAGLCAELDEYLSCDPLRIVLVEPDPDKVMELDSRIDDHPDITIVPAAVSTDSKKAILRIYNYPALSSLRQATGLLKMYPGLRLRDEITVQTIAASELIASLSLDRDHTNCLIIDAPGEELAILDSLRTAGQLDLFEHIVLHAGMISLYQDAPAAERLLKELGQYGFAITKKDDHSDPDRPCWFLHYDPVRRELTELRKKLGELQEERTILSERAERGIKENVALRQEYDALSASLIHTRGELEKLRNEFQALETQMNEKQSELKTLRQQAAESTASLADHKIRLVRVAKEKEDLIRQSDAQKARIQELQSSLTTMEWRQVLMSEEIIKAEGQIELIKDVVLREPGL
jgi:FkbM family methyltransferase